MTSITFGPAEARAKKVIAGLAGATGSGKSFSALELGTGLVADPARHLFMIDTEFGRGAHYADAFKFQYGQLSPPFRPERYIEAINAAIAAGAECVIVDSLSHMWEGENGLLDWHSEIALKMARGNEDRAEVYNFPAWRLPKQALQAFVLYLQRCPVHLILCLRAKQRSKMAKGKDGRTEIVDAGLQPIIDTATPYEATFLAMLSQEDPGVPHWTHKALASYLQPLFQNGGKQLSREHGRKLARWCGETTPAPAERPYDPALEPVRHNPETGEVEDEGTGIEQQISEATAAVGVREWTQAAAKARAGELIAILKDNPDQSVEVIDAAWEIYEGEIVTMPGPVQAHLNKAYNTLRNALPVTTADEDHHDTFARLETDEWKTATGRVEDERQPELLP